MPSEFEQGVRLAVSDLRLDSAPLPALARGHTKADGYLAVLVAAVPFRPLSDV